MLRFGAQIARASMGLGVARNFPPTENLGTQVRKLKLLRQRSEIRISTMTGAGGATPSMRAGMHKGVREHPCSGPPGRMLGILTKTGDAMYTEIW